MVKEIERHKTYRLIELEDGRKAMECRCGTTLLTDEFFCVASGTGTIILQRNFMHYSIAEASLVRGLCPNRKCATYHTAEIPFACEGYTSEENARLWFEKLGRPFQIYDSQSEVIANLTKTRKCVGDSIRGDKEGAEHKRRLALPIEIQEELKKRDDRKRLLKKVRVLTQ